MGLFSEKKDDGRDFGEQTNASFRNQEAGVTKWDLEIFCLINIQKTRQFVFLKKQQKLIRPSY